MIKVYQLSLKAAHKEINEIGRVAAEEKFPEYRAWMELNCFGSEAWKPEYKELFIKVADVRTDDIEEAFMLMNVWNEPHRIELVDGPCRSLSMGDIVVTEDGKWLLCDRFGFKEV